MAKKQVEVVEEELEVVVPEEVTEEVPDPTADRDEAFHRAHTGARADVIYG